MNKTSIEWTRTYLPDGSYRKGFTWNPVTGCTNRCAYCYAQRLAKGRLRNLYLANGNVAPGCDPEDPFSPRMWPDRLNEPFRVKTPSKIFACSMGELFDASVPWSWTEEVLATAGEAGWHTFQFLTKQPHIASRYAFPENAWAGVTVEDGGYPSLMRLYRFEDVQARVRFLSFEPLMGPTATIPEWIDWVIIGAMTGRGAIKPKPEWVQGIIDEADSRGIPVFLKDNLDWPEMQREWPE